MEHYTIYFLIFCLLTVAELLYFRVADRYHIIDKPNRRSSHSAVVLRGGGVVFTLCVWLWSLFFGFPYPWFLAGVTLVAGVSFAGDVGSLGMAFILLFLLGRLVMQTGDVTYLLFLLVYGVDGCLTIVHRILLHEPLGEAHRKHVYQLMANELQLSHVTVSLVYMGLQTLISLGFVYCCPDTPVAHWAYLAGALCLLSLAYVAFKRKYYPLHEAYLRSLKKG